MKFDLASLKSAVAQLEEALEFYRSDIERIDPRLPTHLRAAVIQAFEFTYSLGVRAIERQLRESLVTPDEISRLHYRDLVRHAADAGLVSDPRRWFQWRERRNATSHAYSEAKAEEAVAGLDEFVEDVRFLVAMIERKQR